jgi:hypothetical protein
MNCPIDLKNPCPRFRPAFDHDLLLGEELDHVRPLALLQFTLATLQSAATGREVWPADVIICHRFSGHNWLMSLYKF